MIRALMVFLAVVAALLASCGGNGSFPEPGECLVAAPLPTATPGLPQRGAYFSALRNGIDRIDSQLAQFRAEYPSGNFSRRAEFRMHFAEYSDETRCIATYLRDLPAPGAEIDSFDERMDAALSDLLVHTEFGREAVRKRNVSEWRQWRDGVDAKVEAVRSVMRSR